MTQLYERLPGRDRRATRSPTPPPTRHPTRLGAGALGHRQDVPLDGAAQLGLPEVGQPHGTVGGDQGLAKGRGREGLGLTRLVLDRVPPLQL